MHLTYGWCKSIRGCRGGRIRRIRTRISDRHYHHEQHGRYVNHSNLVTVSIVSTPPKPPNTKVGLLNCQSVRNKTSSAIDHVVHNDLDIVALTETWLKDNGEDQKTIGDLQPSGYLLRHQPRHGKKGGGVGLLYKSTLSMEVLKPFKATSFENYHAAFRVNGVYIRVIVIYRLHPKKQNGLTSSTFFDDFSAVVDKVVPLPGKVIILGDFNIHWDCPSECEPKKLIHILDGSNLTQHVTEPTHQSGHTIDFIITRKEDNLISKVQVSSFLSDHSIVHSELNIAGTEYATRTVRYRKFRTIDLDQFNEDLCGSELDTISADSDVSTNVTKYHNVVTSLIDKHAPLKTNTFVDRPKLPWYNAEIQAAKRHRRQCERLWQRTGLTVHHQMYKEARTTLNTLLESAKAEFYNNRILLAAGDQKVLFKVVDQVLHKRTTLLPTATTPTQLAESFSTFFDDKVKKIRVHIDASDDTDAITEPDADAEPQVQLSSFSSLTQEEVRKIISKSSNSTCELDPLPTWLFKQCLDTLLPSVTSIVNSSLSSGVFPSSMKMSHVRPLIKKLSLDPEVYKNYRPVSNLSFISKLIEKAVSQQLKDHLSNCHMDEPMQSAYKSKHSTETALLKVQNDILCALDENKMVILVLLDLSAAFDTISHDILLQRLEKRLGISGTALKWLKSYITGRSQCVCIGEAISEALCILFGVPQGSVLGPLLFVIYGLPLGDIVRKHHLNFHMYADDTQIYVTFDKKDIDLSVGTMNSCISDIERWMKANKLKLNGDKTELLVLSSKYQPHPPPLESIRVNDSIVHQSSVVRNLGVWFDASMFMQEHITRVVQASYLSIRNIYRIRAVLTPDSLKTVVHAFITARIDYCNSLLVGLPDASISRLQRIQNIAARLVVGAHKHDHITPILHQLHWLPVKYRIDFKVLLLTYRALHGTAPEYLSLLIECHEPSRQLRSSSQNLLVMPKFRLKHYGERSFQGVAPRLWNKLPLLVRTADSVNCFKRFLKTHLFSIAFK